MIDFPASPTIGQTWPLTGRKKWQCIGLDSNGKGIWDLVSTPDSYADRMLTVGERFYAGTYTSDPLTRPDGSARQSGDEYFNSTAGLLKRFNGAAWVAGDLNTANLAASSGSSLVGYQGTTVAARLAEVDALRGAQRTSVLERARASSYVKAMYYRGSAGATDRFVVGYNLNGENGAEFQLLKDFDSMLILRGMSANSLEPGLATRAQNLVGTFVHTSQPNSYTTVVGSKFDLPFTGSGLTFRAYTDNRGGILRFTIDGGSPIDISVFSTVAANAASPPFFTIATGLADTAHTCVVEFMGADPSNPPSGGTARGWFYYNPINTLQYTGYGTTTGARLMVLSGATTLMAGSSIPDFAISATKNGSGITADWVPAHSSAGACRNITTTVLVDGVDVGTTFASYPAIQQCECVIVKHTYDAYSTYDVGGTYKLWTGVLVKKFDKTGLTISHNIKLTNDVYCAAGYFASMVPVMTAAINKAVYSSGYKDTVATAVGAETNTSVPGAPSSVLLYGTTNNKGVACEVQSTADALGLFSKPLEADAVFLNERTDGVAKSYWRRWYQEVIPSGSEHSITTKFFPVVNVDVTQF